MNPESFRGWGVFESQSLKAKDRDARMRDRFGGGTATKEVTPKVTLAGRDNTTSRRYRHPVLSLSGSKKNAAL